MFCYQRSFGLPTEIVTAERFWALVRAPHTSELIDGYRTTGDAALKRKLPAFIFQATFEETVSKKGNKGAWRCQTGSRLNGLVVMDVDHVENPQEVHGEWLKVHGDLKELGVLLVYITPSGHGLKIVFKARTEWGNLIDNQHEMAKLPAPTARRKEYRSTAASGDPLPHRAYRPPLLLPEHLPVHGDR